MSYPHAPCSKRVGARALAAVATFLAFASIPAWAYFGMVCPAVFLSKLALTIAAVLWLVLCGFVADRWNR